MTAESRHSLPSRTFSGGLAVSNYKDLEDMNLVDNFLFGTAVSNEEYGPLIAGTILETIFHRKIKIKNVQSEKVVWPSNPELHGIRLDAYIEEEAAAVELGNIYDIEPEKKSGEKTLLPKRCRYYNTRIDENQLKAGSAWADPDDLIFTDIVGGTIPHSSVEHEFAEICERVGITGHRFHDLRHTFATLSLQHGADPKTLSQALGHYSVAFTLDVYGHVSDEMANNFAAIQEKIIANPLDTEKKN